MLRPLMTTLAHEQISETTDGFRCRTAHIDDADIVGARITGLEVRGCSDDLIAVGREMLHPLAGDELRAAAAELRDQEDDFHAVRLAIRLTCRRSAEPMRGAGPVPPPA